MDNSPTRPTGLDPPTPLAVRRASTSSSSSGPDAGSALQAAREIRRLTETSQRCRLLLSDAVPPPFLCIVAEDDGSAGALELRLAALVALLNLAVKDDE